MNVVECSIHGKAPEAFVCQHLLTSMKDEMARGFFFSRDENQAINAWCNLCEDYVSDNGNQWNGSTEKFANISLVCEPCAIRAATICGVEVDR